MNTFLKYLGAFCLLTIAASLAFCSVGVYNGMQTANRLLAGADNYTCRQFNYDLTDPQADKFAAMAIATVLYGGGNEDENSDRQDDVAAKGINIAVLKAVKLCEGKPDERLLNLFAQSLASPAAGSVSSTQTPAVVTPAPVTKN
ncbi:MAG: hypothetical protein EON60_06885 [Alphaproteobacteria bacterium]|nr:MAG: hypothetical protein EON60_06885 [Alphaproteobacteria bacterium]